MGRSFFFSKHLLTKFPRDSIHATMPLPSICLLIHKQELRRRDDRKTLWMLKNICFFGNFLSCLDFGVLDLEYTL